MNDSTSTSWHGTMAAGSEHLQIQEWRRTGLSSLFADIRVIVQVDQRRQGFLSTCGREKNTHLTGAQSLVAWERICSSAPKRSKGSRRHQRRHVRSSYEPYFFNKEITFFSHNKSANNTFSYGFSVKRTGPMTFWRFKWCACVRLLCR